MAQPEPRSPNNNRPRNNGNPDPNFNWRGLILFSIAIALIAGAYLANQGNARVLQLPYAQFVQMVENRPEDIIVDAKNSFDIVRDTQTAKEYLEGTMKTPEGLKRFQT